ncbi:MAG: hypothetical protein K9M10_02020 [Candidatus Pacebacteria bacterium]|nr:hypothetical protein [Candidatus Paceibacterota bacterium]MCF7857241.1 hypothetical protein [Candidatus Paceibacterota bacterium]
MFQGSEYRIKGLLGAAFGLLCLVSIPYHTVHAVLSSTNFTLTQHTVGVSKNVGMSSINFKLTANNGKTYVQTSPVSPTVSTSNTQSSSKKSTQATTTVDARPFIYSEVSESPYKKIATDALIKPIKKIAVEDDLKKENIDEGQNEKKNDDRENGHKDKQKIPSMIASVIAGDFQGFSESIQNFYRDLFRSKTSRGIAFVTFLGLLGIIRIKTNFGNTYLRF